MILSISDRALRSGGRRAAHDVGVGAVVVDGFVVFGADRKPGDVVVLQETRGDVAHDVFDELGVVVALFGDPLFVNAFEHGVNIAGSTRLHQVDHVFEPDETVEAGLQLYFATLVMGAGIADLLGAGANRGDGNVDFGDQVDFVAGVAAADDAAGVVHQSGCAADRRLFFDEIGEGHFDMRRGGIQVLLHFVEQFGKAFERYFGFEQMEHFHEAAHVGALVFVGQVHVHVDRGHGGLAPFAAVAHGDGVAQVLDPDFVDGDVAGVALILDVFHVFSSYGEVG